MQHGQINWLSKGFTLYPDSDEVVERLCQLSFQHRGNSFARQTHLLFLSSCRFVLLLFRNNTIYLYPRLLAC